MNNVTIPKREYESLKAAYRQLKRVERAILEDEIITEEDILRWSKEAKTLKKQGKLPVLESLRELRGAL
ncbi:MAG: hypothetical protein HYT66_01190 [Candidatus Yanofskybacteria bacterium]|nr:hypothetical protein [Candidatus Yanofskybacteria bacterium]MBI4120222.1 hypothetical protein [Parcubacteria group bacterium]